MEFIINVECCVYELYCNVLSVHVLHYKFVEKQYSLYWYIVCFPCSLRRAIQQSCWWTAWKPWWLRTVSRVMTWIYWTHIPVPWGSPPISTSLAPCPVLVWAVCTPQQIRTLRKRTVVSLTATECAMDLPTICLAKIGRVASSEKTARKKLWKPSRIELLAALLGVGCYLSSVKPLEVHLLFACVVRKNGFRFYISKLFISLTEIHIPWKVNYILPRCRFHLLVQHLMIPNYF